MRMGVPLNLILQHPPLKCWESVAPCPRGLPAVFLKEEGAFQVWGPSPTANITNNKSRWGNKMGRWEIIRYTPQTLEIRKTLDGQILLSVTSLCVTGWKNDYQKNNKINKNKVKPLKPGHAILLHFFLIYLVYMYVHEWARTCRDAHVEVRGQPGGGEPRLSVNSLPPPHGFQASNSGHPAWCKHLYPLSYIQSWNITASLRKGFSAGLIKLKILGWEH